MVLSGFGGFAVHALDARGHGLLPKDVASPSSPTLLFPANRLSDRAIRNGGRRWSSKGTVGAHDGSEQCHAGRGFRSVIPVTPSRSELCFS